MHVLDNGICITCEPSPNSAARAHELVDGRCVTCAPVVARFDPSEPRDPHTGKWGLGGASAVLSIPVKVAGGLMHVESHGDGHAKLSDGHGRSVTLSEGEAKALGKMIRRAKYGESDHAGGDGVFRLDRREVVEHDGRKALRSTALVSLRPVTNSFIDEDGKKFTDESNAPHHGEYYTAEFDMVLGEGQGDFKDEPMTRVSLANLEDRGGIEQAVEHSLAARRVPAAGGAVDVFVPRPGAVGLRAGKGEQTLNARSYRRVRDTITDTIYGTEEQGDLSEKLHDAHETVKTSSGTFEVAFHGMRERHGRYSPDSTLTITGADGWTVHATGDHIAELIEAMAENAGVAGISED